MGIELRILQDLLCCPECRGALRWASGVCECTGCQRRYPVRDGVPDFVTSDRLPRQSPEGWLTDLKDRLKTWPRLYNGLSDCCSPMLMGGKGYRLLLDRLPAEATVLNLGAGTKRLGPNVMNVDWTALPGVDVVADLTRLPFRDEVADGLVCEAALEHLADPRAAMREMRRVLKSRGYLYVVVPFLQGYHASPDDYSRWTPQGLRIQLEQVDIIELGVRSGPTSALLWTAQEWLAMALSWNIPAVYRALWMGLTMVTFPVKFLDLILARYSMAWKIAGSFYCLGMKR